MPYKVAVLITCHNRVDFTIKCLKSLLIEQNKLDVYLVDDNSTDQTKDVVNELFPQVNLIDGDGNLFWNRGMYLAWVNASRSNYDYYLWVNDDVVLDPSYFQELFECSELNNGEAIISGLVENDKGQTIYGGTDAHDNLYQANGKLNSIKNLNGNVVLVPRYVFEKVGFLDNQFHHDIGDVDYGLRAKKLGISVLTTRINIGKGHENNICRVRKNNVSLINRFKVLYSPLGANPIHHFVFLKRHKGTLPALFYFFFLHFLNFIPDSINLLLFRKKYV